VRNGNNLSWRRETENSLARALYKEPDLLILHEATSALDNRSELLIQKAIEEIRDRTITISIAHRLSTIESADRILVFKDGKILSLDGRA